MVLWSCSAWLDNPSEVAGVAQRQIRRVKALPSAMSEEAAKQVVPYLPLEAVHPAGRATEASQGAAKRPEPAKVKGANQ